MSQGYDMFSRAAAAIAVPVLLMVIDGCGGDERHTAKWEFALRGVERSPQATTAYGEYVLGSRQIGPMAFATFEDQLVSVAWFVIDTRAHFILENKSADTVTLHWDQALFVNDVGESGPVTHRRVKYGDCGGPKKPSVIRPRRSLSDEIVPCVSVPPAGGTEVMESFLPGPRGRGAVSDSLLQTMRGKVGSTVSFLLPLEARGVLSSYSFQFEITGVSCHPVEF